MKCLVTGETGVLTGDNSLASARTWKLRDDAPRHPTYYRVLPDLGHQDRGHQNPLNARLGLFCSTNVLLENEKGYNLESGLFGRAIWAHIYLGSSQSRQKHQAR